MLTINNNHNRTLREKILEKRIEILQERIHQLETEKVLKLSSSQLDNEHKTTKTKPSFLMLPVAYTPEQERSPTLEIVSYSPTDETNDQLLLVEQVNKRIYETNV